MRGRVDGVGSGTGWLDGYMGRGVGREEGSGGGWGGNETEGVMVNEEI